MTFLQKLSFFIFFSNNPRLFYHSRQKKIAFTVASCILIIISILPITVFSAPIPSKAKSYILRNVKTGKLLLEKNPNLIYPMASLTKLGTALLVSKYLPPDTYIKVTNEIPITNNYESRADLKVGEEYKVADLYYGLLLPSGNDVARLFAKELETKGEEFKRIAESWRIENKIDDYQFEEPVGISSNSKTSARGMIKILDMIRQTKYLYDVLQVKEYFLVSKLNYTTKVITRTPLHEFGKVKIFGKTGKTKSAGLCFAGFLQMDDGLFQIVLLGSEDLENDLSYFSEYLMRNKKE